MSHGIFLPGHFFIVIAFYHRERRKIIKVIRYLRRTSSNAAFIKRVIGRPITQAEDPCKVLRTINSELSDAVGT